MTPPEESAAVQVPAAVSIRQAKDVAATATDGTPLASAVAPMHPPPLERTNTMSLSLTQSLDVNRATDPEAWFLVTHFDCTI